MLRLNKIQHLILCPPHVHVFTTRPYFNNKEIFKVVCSRTKFIQMKSKLIFIQSIGVQLVLYQSDLIRNHDHIGKLDLFPNIVTV